MRHQTIDRPTVREQKNLFAREYVTALKVATREVRTGHFRCPVANLKWPPTRLVVARTSVRHAMFKVKILVGISEPTSYARRGDERKKLVRKSEAHSCGRFACMTKATLEEVGSGLGTKILPQAPSQDS